MIWPDSIHQSSLFDKALFIHQHGKIVESYKEGNLKYTIYQVGNYKVELVYNITYSQMQDVIVKENSRLIFK